MILQLKTEKTTCKQAPNIRRFLMSFKYLFFVVFIIVVILFLKDFIKNYRSYKKQRNENNKKKGSDI
jgi:hypothetical protein